MSLLRLASDHQHRLTVTSERAARRVVRLWRSSPVAELDYRWDSVAPQIERVVSRAQATAARQADAYVTEAAREQGVSTPRARVIPEAFTGVTREGREITPELYTAVATTKTLVGRGVGIGQAFHAGAAYMYVMAASLVRDAGRSADRTAAVSRGARHSVRVVQEGACSRCAILAGVIGYRVDFQRHPGCRCTSMWLWDDEVPDGFYRDTTDYFESLTPSEQDRIFTKAGAEAIRHGANPIQVVNARRGALTTLKRPDVPLSPARLRPVRIGTRADGSPILVYATPEGTTARSRWMGDSRYRRSSSVRLMPEQIMRMSTDPDRIRELLRQYGYLY